MGKNDDYIGIVTNSTTLANKAEDDFWTVKQTIIQKRTKDGENWEEKEISMSSKDRNLDDAFKQAMLSIAVYLDSIGGDLFYEDLQVEVDDDDLASLPESKYIQ